MNAFDIADNNLDFDTTENTKSQVKQKEMVKQKVVVDSIEAAIKSCKTIAEVKHLWDANPELQAGSPSFVKMITARKKILTDNGITE
jgi:Ran GTPase-activating protein (RanGAP) involved in mRNA processing and transport